jgi:acyl-CoA thioesterase
MQEETLATRIVDKMFSEDRFSQWLGIERVVVEQGRSVLRMMVRSDMSNGFGIAHGGICFSFADSALAFASNGYGLHCVALECSISFPAAVRVGDILTCEAKEFSRTNRTAVYLIEIKNQNNIAVAFFKGTVYRTHKEWFPEATTGGSQ